MRTVVLPPRVLDAIKNNRTAYLLARQARFAAGGLLPPRRFPTVPGAVHRNDFTLKSDASDDVATYRSGGLDVISVLNQALEAGGRTWADVDSFLDYGCGYGRVLRWIVERVRPANVYAIDVIPEAVSFCSREFGVWGRPAPADIGDPSLGRFDLVYAGSVLTHLPKDLGTGFLSATKGLLRPGGVFVFTTHGERCLDDIPGDFGTRYRPRVDAIRQAFAATGSAYVPYGYYADDDYGLAWHSESYIDTAMRSRHGSTMERLSFIPHGLGYQDVYVYRRSTSTA